MKILALLAALVSGCYAGGIGHWKNMPQTPVPVHCQNVMNPCGQPWSYPPLHS